MRLFDKMAEKKVVHRQEVIRGHKGRPSRKHLEDPSALRKFSENLSVYKSL